MSQEIERKELFGHPMGLFVLFFTEMWERFSYYGMRAILVLYMVSVSTGDNPGLGWTKGNALALYGWYTMLVYVMSIPGGIIADKLLGQKRTVLIGGILLCAGHLVLAVEQDWAFILGLALIILGVGGLKPNISTMVGGLYKVGDVRRDSGFTIFYIGINVGALLAGVIVGTVGEVYGWHYGFGLAGIGMLLGQAVYMLGQKHLIGVGDFMKKSEDPEAKAASSKPLTRVEKDRMIVMLLSFVIIIVFWGAFEQAGGLMNIYTLEKINRSLFGIEIKASVFQSANPLFIIIFGTLVAGFWVWWAKKGKENSSLFKMAIGTIIMGVGFLVMAGAANEVIDTGGKAGVYWLIGAYLLHTIGELCASPVALSFVSKLAPLKYASLMMGAYFAATGFGNKIAGTVGEAAQSEPLEIEFKATDAQLRQFAADSVINKKQNFVISTNLILSESKVEFTDANGKELTAMVNLPEDGQKLMNEETSSLDSKENLHATLNLGFPEEGGVRGNLVIDEVQNEKELNIFLFIFGFTGIFGIALLLMLKPLKRLTHGAEDMEGSNHEEQEGFEISDKEA